MPSRVYFPLRSNGSSLLAGRPVDVMRRRILRSAILHDEVYLEGGVNRIHAGPNGSMGWYSMDDSAKWQSPRQRGVQRGRQFHMAVRPTGAPETAPFTPMLVSKADVAWEPTFEPFKKELGRVKAPWLKFGHMDDPREIARDAGSMFNPDYKDDRLKELYPEQFVRNLIIKNANLDVGIGSVLGAAVAVDAVHAQVMLARVARGDAVPVLGDLAVRLIIDVELDWETVAWLRRERWLNDYRAILLEIEEAARDAATNPEDLQRRVREHYLEKLREAEARRPTEKVKLLVGAGSIAVGHAASAALGAPWLLTDALAYVAGDVMTTVAEAALKPRWLTVHKAVTRVHAATQSPVKEAA